MYIHHVPGRLRLRTPRLKGNRLAAAATCDDALALPGVLEAHVNTATGSLVIAYDREKLTPAALWAALCERGLASGPPPIGESAPVTRAHIDPPSGAADQNLAERVAGIVLDRLLERSAAALIGALI